MAKNKTKLKPIDSTVYGYWTALYRSFYSRRLYVDVGKRWRGFGIFYFLLAIALFTIPYALKMSADFNTTFNQQLMQPIVSLPRVMVQNGEVHFDKPMPYLVKNNQDQVVSIVDTTGKVTEFTSQYPYLTILINKNTMSFKIPTPRIPGVSDLQETKGTILAQPFKPGASFVIDGRQLIHDKSFAGFKFASQLMIYPLVVATLFSILIVVFLVFAFLGQVFSSVFFAFKLSLKQSCRLFLVASTPTLAVLIFFLATNWLFPGLGFVLFALLIGYFAFAIHSLRAESRTVVMQ